MGTNPKQEQALALQASCSLTAPRCLQFCAELNTVPAGTPFQQPLQEPRAGQPKAPSALGWAEQAVSILCTLCTGIGQL